MTKQIFRAALGGQAGGVSPDSFAGRIRTNCPPTPPVLCSAGCQTSASSSRNRPRGAAGPRHPARPNSATAALRPGCHSIPAVKFRHSAELITPRFPPPTIPPAAATLRFPLRTIWSASSRSNLREVSLINIPPQFSQTAKLLVHQRLALWKDGEEITHGKKQIRCCLLSREPKERKQFRTRR